MPSFGHLPLEAEASQVSRLIRTALLVSRESDPHLSALPIVRFYNLLRRLQVSMDVLCFRLRSRAPRTPDGRIPVSIPRQQQVVQLLRRQCISMLVQPICRQARPAHRETLDDLVATVFQDWFDALLLVMLRA